MGWGKTLTTYRTETRFGMSGSRHKPKTRELLCDDFTPQPAKPAKVASVAGVGTCIKPARDRRHLKIAGPSTSLVGDCQACINSYDPRCALWKPAFDKAEDLLIGS